MCQMCALEDIMEDDKLISALEEIIEYHESTGCRTCKTIKMAKAGLGLR